MREGVDFVLVTRNVLTYLVDKYRSVEGEPHINFKRLGVE